MAPYVGNLARLGYIVLKFDRILPLQSVDILIRRVELHQSWLVHGRANQRIHKADLCKGSFADGPVRDF